MSFSNDEDTPLFVLEPNPNIFENLNRDYRKAIATNSSLIEVLHNVYFDYKLRIPPKEVSEVRLSPNLIFLQYTNKQTDVLSNSIFMSTLLP